MPETRRIQHDRLKDLALLEIFLNNAGTSLNSFRYFNTRPLSSISNHLITILLFEEEFPIGYGHIDKEEGVNWLGICIAQNSTGKSYGKSIMNELVSFADIEFLDLKLTVDRINHRAISLYEKFNFHISDTRSLKYFVMEREFFRS